MISTTGTSCVASVENYHSDSQAILAKTTPSGISFRYGTMKTWQIILVAAFGLIFLVMLVIFICFIIGLLILNFIMLNLDTVLTNQPARMAFTSAQALADARIRR